MPDLAQLTVARRYASALLMLAKEQGKLDDVAADVAALKSVVEADPSILRRLGDPKTRGREKAALVDATLAVGRHALVKNLLGVLVRRRRETLLPELFFAFGEELERALGVVRIEVETATEPDAGFAADLGAKLGAATSRTVVLETRVRPEILGGMKLFFDSKLIDASIASRLTRLKKTLLAAGA